MIEDVFIIDATVHAHNLHPDNWVGPQAHDLVDIVTEAHQSWQPQSLVLPKDVFLGGCSAEVLAWTCFTETPIDFAGHHHIPLYSWFKDGAVSKEKNRELAERWPDRFAIYVGVDPTADLDDAIRSMEQQVEEVPDAIGLKLYPTQINPLREFNMGDQDKAFPLYERARELGLKVIAAHKAMPYGPVPANPFGMDDMEVAATHFPDLNFEFIHAGWSFVEETAHAIGRYPNVYANLEFTSLFLNASPQLFEDILAQFMFWGGPEKIFWSAGCMYVHPLPPLERFWDFQFSQATLDKWRIPQITREDKTMILGQSYADMIGLDIEETKKKIADDAFSTFLREHGQQPPNTAWIKDAKTQGLVA